MNKEKKLIWKFFIEQKLGEIGILLGLLIILTIIPWFLGRIIETDLFNSGITGFFIGYWTTGILLLLIICAILLGLLIVLSTIFEWISSNWDKAKQRAKKEVRNGKKNQRSSKI